MRTVPRILLALAATLLGSLALAVTPAQAADAYRGWIYFQVKGGTYVPSQLGAGGTVPKDGTIEAYRYAAPKDYTKPNLPRVDLKEVTFDAVCGDTEAADGKKRVAVILDYGVEADAEGQEIPGASAECAQVPQKATGFQTLSAVAKVRSKTSDFGPLVCGIEGYPSKGCADVVTQTPTPPDQGFVEVAINGASEPTASSGDPTDGTTDSTASDETADEDSSTALYVGLGVVIVALVAGGVVMARRRGQS